MSGPNREACQHCGLVHRGNGNVVADLVACRNKLLADLNALRESLDPKWDATEAASDAWWRGHDDAARRCREVRDRLVAERDRLQAENERLAAKLAGLRAEQDRRQERVAELVAPAALSKLTGDK